MGVIPDFVSKELAEEGLCVNQDHKVAWCDNAQAHPKNWPFKRKLFDTGVLTAFITVSAMIGNVGTSTADSAIEEFGVSSYVGNLCFGAMFFFGQASGSLVLPPYTESFGRKRANVVAALLYMVSCVVVGVPRSLPAVTVGRFFSGFLSTLPTVIGSGCIEDMWDVRDRIWAIDIWIKGSIVGIAAGPSFATFVSTSSLEWPWVYHISAILLACVTVLFLWTRESRPSVLLRRKLEMVISKTGFQDLDYDSPDKVPSLRVFARTMLIRPTRFFFTERAIMAVSVMSGVVFSSIYLQTEGLKIAYAAFGYTERERSLVFYAWVVGLVLTLPLRIYDWIVVSDKIRRGEAISPESKLTGFYLAAPVLTTALWWFAWTIPPEATSISPFVSMAALVLMGACLNEFDSLLQGYLTDAYRTYAASANAPLAVLRGILSGAFPIFAAKMFSSLGSNLAVSILAVVATVFCGVAVWFWRNGALLRENSPYAVKMEHVEQEAGDKLHE